VGMPEAPKQSRRRWFQFGVGTMFLVVTVVAAFLAYHVNWIRERHALVNAAGDSKTIYSFDVMDPFAPDLPSTPEKAPGLLGLFGEHGYHNVEIIFSRVLTGDSGISNNRDLMPSELAEVRRVQVLFPEAEVRGWGIDKK
jgi:hypothetical protein